MVVPRLRRRLLLYVVLGLAAGLSGLFNGLQNDLWGRAAGRPQAQASEKESSHDETYLNLVVKLQSSGSPEILKATEVSGKLIMRKEPSSRFVYEITKDGKTFLVGFLPEDPFVVRGFADPKHERQEDTAKTESATIILSIPNTDADAAASGRIGIRFYKLRAGSASPETMTVPIFKELLGESKAALQFDLSAGALSAEMKKVSASAPR
jgi:hypothetical protein